MYSKMVPRKIEQDSLQRQGGLFAWRLFLIKSRFVNAAVTASTPPRKIRIL